MALHVVSWEDEDRDLQILKEGFYPEQFGSNSQSRKQAVSKVSTHVLALEHSLTIIRSQRIRHAVQFHILLKLLHT